MTHPTPKNYTRAFGLTAVALAAILSACGGGSSNHPAVFAGIDSGTLHEGETTTIGGTITVTDPDNAQSAFLPPTNLTGTYGTFSFIPTTGAWTYQLNNTSAPTQGLKTGQAVTDTLRIFSIDGSLKDVVVTIQGGSPAAFSGSDSGTLYEGETTTIGGTITVTDPDNAQSGFLPPTNLTGTYGTFSFTPTTGTWTYQLNNTSAATQGLKTGQAVTDTLRIFSIDGSLKDVVVTIQGNSIVTSVPAPVYTSDDPYSADKVAVINRLNDDRSRCGFGKLTQNLALDKAAQSHSDYLKLNGLVGHYQTPGQQGFVAQSPTDRVVFFGYPGVASEGLAASHWGPNLARYSGKNNLKEVSSTQQLKSLYSTIYHLGGTMSTSTDVGVGVNNIPRSDYFLKHLTLDYGWTASNRAGQKLQADSLASFPCEGVKGLNPTFLGESPEPFPDRGNSAYGHPIFVTVAEGQVLTLSPASSINLDGSTVPVPTRIMTQSNDPNKFLTSNQAYLTPTTSLSDNSTYKVVLIGTSSGMKTPTNPTGSFERKFSFTTSTFLSD